MLTTPLIRTYSREAGTAAYHPMLIIEYSPYDLYTVWAEANGITGEPSDLTGGVPNLLIYALGGDSASPATDFQLNPSVDPTGMTLSFTRIDDPALTYEIWATQNLMDGWGDTPLWTGQGPDDSPIHLEATSQNFFIRLQVRKD